MDRINEAGFGLTNAALFFSFLFVIASALRFIWISYCHNRLAENICCFVTSTSCCCRSERLSGGCSHLRLFLRFWQIETLESALQAAQSGASVTVTGPSGGSNGSLASEFNIDEDDQSMRTISLVFRCVVCCRLLFFHNVFCCVFLIVFFFFGILMCGALEALI